VPVAIVTGSESGIGRAAAVRLAADGFDVGVTWHNDEQGGQETANEIRRHDRRAEVRRLDLGDLPAAADVIDELADALDGVDVLVNNAGTGGGAALLELSYEDWRHTLAVDLDGAFLCAQRAARRMVTQGRGGRIVNVTSVHEHAPRMNSTAYTVAKHGLGGLTKQLAVELGRYGITANSLAPGAVATPMTGLEDEEPSHHPRPTFPIPRLGDAREIASCIAWLCSADAGWTTGASFLVDGGFMLVNPSARPERRD
jgi:NAD(P)-dependent dehydrogenase (short-subunit alcohol dehydrogenase family)